MKVGQSLIKLESFCLRDLILSRFEVSSSRHAQTTKGFKEKMEMAINFVVKRSNKQMVKVIAFYLHVAANTKRTLDPRAPSRSKPFTLQIASKNALKYTILASLSTSHTHTDGNSSIRVSLSVLK